MRFLAVDVKDATVWHQAYKLKVSLEEKGSSSGNLNFSQHCRSDLQLQLELESFCFAFEIGYVGYYVDLLFVTWFGENSCFFSFSEVSQTRRISQWTMSQWNLEQRFLFSCISCFDTEPRHYCKNFFPPSATAPLWIRDCTGFFVTTKEIVCLKIIW